MQKGLISLIISMLVIIFVGYTLLEGAVDLNPVPVILILVCIIYLYLMVTAISHVEISKPMFFAAYIINFIIGILYVIYQSLIATITKTSLSLINSGSNVDPGPEFYQMLSLSNTLAMVMSALLIISLIIFWTGYAKYKKEAD